MPSRTFLLSAFFVAAAIAALGQPAPILIDTDAGSDDLMAIAFLLAQPGIRVEAVTVVNGLAHPEAGARNIARLLELAHRPDIPVFVGRSEPLRGRAEFPAEWRRISDQLPGVKLPELSHPLEKRPAVDYLIERLNQKNRPVRVLALGPFTNLAEALQRSPSGAGTIQEIVMMGGALRVAGNLTDGGVFKTDNKTAEWNIFVDPLAARMVFRSGIKIEMIGLDATNTVPIGAAFMRQLESEVHSPLGRFVAEVLHSDRESIDGGYMYAWDPLAAVALLHPGVVKTAQVHVEIRQDTPEEGRTAEAAGQPNAKVALQADRDQFIRLFLDAFAR
jgi:pyrimidine-specific ribonucleoside hydrolase